MAQRTLHVVTTLDLPDLQPYRTLRRARDHIEQRIFVAEGEKVVRRLLGSGLEPVSFLMTPEWDEELRRTEPAYLNSTGPVYVAARSLLSEIVGYRMHQGIMAVAKVPEDPDISTILVQRRPLLVALDGLMNAENVGVVVRNCAGFGVDAILVGETSSSPFLRRAVRNSMGTVFSLRVLHSRDLPDDLHRVRAAGNIVIGTTPSGTPFPGSADLRGGVCLVLGNEEAGISAPVRAACDHLSSIPMMNGTDSLNVSSASAVFLFEVRRRRELPVL